MSNEYGVAQFYRSDAWSREGLKEHWLLQPKLSGNEIANGDFESWSGAEGGCTDCPRGWICDCTSGGGDINPETTKIYKGTSAKLDVSNVYGSALVKTKDFLANKIYQISFWYKGEAGTEDFYFLVGKLDISETYNFDTDTWTGGLSVYVINVADTAWTKVVTYIKVGAADKLAAAGYGFGWICASSSGTALYISDLQVREMETQIVGEMGNVLSVPVTSDPEWGDSEELLGRVGTGPAGNMGTKFDGVDDYLSRADDGSFDPVNWESGGSFSVGCRMMPSTIASGQDVIISKYNGSGNQRSWEISRSNNDIAAVVSSDGTSGEGKISYPACSNVLRANVLHNLTWSYLYDIDGASNSNITVDENTPATHANIVGPPHDTNGDFVVGSLHGGSNFWDGSISEVAVWKIALSTIETNKWRNPYFPGTNHGDGFYVDTCTQATTWANCSTQKCRDGTPNACQAEGTGVMAIFGAYTEILSDNSFETFTGDDSNPTFTHWTALETPGNGTANITAYRADTKHGDVAIRSVTTGTTSYTLLVSGCKTTGIGSDVYVSAQLKALAGVGRMVFQFRQWESVDCSTGYIGVNQFYDTGGVVSDPTWTEYGDLFGSGEWDGTAASYELRIYIAYQKAADVLIDTISLKAASYHTPWIHKLAGAETAYSARDYRLHNPLADYSEELDEDMYESGFCVSTWVYSDWAGDDGANRDLFFVTGTAGLNNRWQVSKNPEDNVQLVLYDSAGVFRIHQLAVTDTNWTAGDWKYIEACSDNAGTIAGHHYNANNATWYTWPDGGGAGTGIQDGQTSELHVGHSTATNFVDGYISEINMVPYSAIFPQAGFNSGKPPSNGPKPY